MTLTDADARSMDLPADDPLAAALADPEVREALAIVAQNAPDLAVLLLAAKGLLARSRDITDNVNERVDYLREAIDPQELRDYLELRHALNDALPTIRSFLESPILRPEIVQLVGRAGEAALEAEERSRRTPAPLTVRGLWRQLRDPVVQETISFALEFAQAFGRRQMLGR